MSIGSPSDRLRVGVDIGGSKIAVLVVDAANKVRARDRMPLAATEPDAAISQIATAVRATVTAAGATMTAVDGVGVGVPGRLDSTAGTVTFAVNLGWQDVPLRHRLEDELGVPCLLENDVRA